MRNAALHLALVILGPLSVACHDRVATESAVPPGLEAATKPIGRVLLVGIDGATFDRIEPLRAAGRLPALDGVMARGAWARLETLEPTVSPAIWTTIATGKSPAEHGILGFQGVPGETMTTLPTSQMRRVRAFWNVLSEHDRRVGVVGWWATWPAERVNGYVVSDRVAYTRMEAALGADEFHDFEVFPRSLEAEVRAQVLGPSEIQASQVRMFMDLDDEQVQRLIQGAEYAHGHFLPEFKYVHQSDRSTVNIALRLLADEPVDVAAVALYGVDTVSHLTWHFSEPEKFPDLPARALVPELVEKFRDVIDRYYEYTDRLLGELLEAAGPEVTVIVFSDHGFGPTGQLPWSGGHGRITPGAPIAPDGILIVAGPDVPAAGELERAHVLDIAPTLLYLQGLPTAQDMPGRVLTRFLSDAVTQNRAVASIPTYETSPRERIDQELLADPELDAATLEKLCRLGYIECP